MNITSTIDVDVDPKTAFAAFTDELDQWWGNGPIDAWDSSRCIGRRLEPGVGGRLLELYEDEALELGRVTVWEPGARVCWQSSVDDVVIEVYFDPIATGTRVRVDGIVPDGKIGDAGLSFVRMTRSGSRGGSSGARRRVPSCHASMSSSTTPSQSPPHTGCAMRSGSRRRHRCPTKTRRRSTGSRSASATAPSCCTRPLATPRE